MSTPIERSPDGDDGDGPLAGGRRVRAETRREPDPRGPRAGPPPLRIRWLWIVPPALLLTFVVAMAWGWTTVGFEVRPEEANGTIHQRFAIPAMASRVSFVSTPKSSSVRFDVDREGFEAWCRGRGFRPVPITTERPGMAFTIDRAGVVLPDGLVSGGLTFEEPGECSISGCYDANRCRCYAVFSCR